MEYKTLIGHEEIEANELGDVRWVRSKEKLRVFSEKGGSCYFRYYPDGRKEKEQRITTFHLIARLFVPNPNNYKWVQAIDGDNSNYRASNLQWTKSNRRNTLTAEEVKVRRREYDRNQRQKPERKEKQREYMKQWREQNRERANELARDYSRIRSASVPCDCGGCVSVKNQTRHFSSKRHQDWLAQQQPPAQSESDSSLGSSILKKTFLSAPTVLLL